jgi:hypothetical protein
LIQERKKTVFVLVLRRHFLGSQIQGHRIARVTVLDGQKSMAATARGSIFKEFGDQFPAWSEGVNLLHKSHFVFLNPVTDRSAGFNGVVPETATLVGVAPREIGDSMCANSYGEEFIFIRFEFGFGNRRLHNEDAKREVNRMT